MAEQATVELHAPSVDDYPAHAQAYEGFLAVTKWGTIGAVIILILMAIFLV